MLCFGWFTIDPLEKYFGKLQQVFGGHIMSVQFLLTVKVGIHCTKLNVEFYSNKCSNIDLMIMSTLHFNVVPVINH